MIDYGIYLIECLATQKVYVGSSKNIKRRWNEHRKQLSKGLSPCLYLQRAWTKYGEEAFRFEVVERCAENDLLIREQAYIDRLRPALNVMLTVERWVPSAEMEGRRLATMRAIAAARTHCPKGHEYTPENTYLGKIKGERRCKACNRERVAAIYAAETPEQTAERLRKGLKQYHSNYEARRAKQNEYAARTREKKRAYDADPANLARKNARRMAADEAKRANHGQLA